MLRTHAHKTVLILALSALLPVAAMAHEAEKGPNGGALIDVDGHHVEFLPSGSDLTFILTGDKDAPIASAGAKMKAIIQDAGKTTQVELAPAEPNKLVGTALAPITPGAKVVVTGTLPDGHALQGRFVVP